MGDTAGASARLVSPASRSAVEAASSLPGALISVSAPASIDAASIVSDLLAGRGYSDVRVAYPEGARWKVGEFVESVIDPSSYLTGGRHIVVAEAARALPVVHDRLLKRLEEPAGDATVWLVHDDNTPLPATLRGRVAHQISLVPAPYADLVDTLVDSGVPSETAEALLRAAAGDASLATTAHKFGLADQLAQFNRSYKTGTPTGTASEVLLACAHLAVAYHHKVSRSPAAPRSTKGTLPQADLTKLNPQARATLRKLVGRVLDRWEAELTADSVTVGSAARFDGFDALREARAAALFNAPLATILASALSGLNI